MIRSGTHVQIVATCPVVQAQLLTTPCVQHMLHTEHTVYITVFKALLFHGWQHGKDFYDSFSEFHSIPSYGMYPDKGRKFKGDT